MPTFETLSITLQDHIATVRLNRPDKANAMNAAMWQEIRQAFQWVDATPEARVAVLQGEGKLFTAGIDLQMMMGLGPQIQLALLQAGPQVVFTLRPRVGPADRLDGGADDAADHGRVSFSLAARMSCRSAL